MAFHRGVRCLSLGSGGRAHSKARASGVLPWRRGPSQAEGQALGERKRELGLCWPMKAHELGIRLARTGITGHCPVPGMVPGTLPFKSPSQRGRFLLFPASRREHGSLKDSHFTKAIRLGRKELGLPSRTLRPKFMNFPEPDSWH